MIAGYPVLEVALPVNRATVVSLSSVRKCYGNHVAVADVSFAAGAGEAVSVLGPNGAGKTTLVSLILGLRRADRGEIRVFGDAPLSMAARRRVGALPQEMGLPMTLTVREIIDFVARHYPDPAPAGELLERFDLGDVAKRQAGGLSGGLRRRVALALAFVGRPELLVLDEPTTGLDVEARLRVWADIERAVAGGTTVLLTTHNLEEAEALTERVIVVNAGSIVADGSVREIKARVGFKRVSVRADLPPDLPGIAQIVRTGDVTTCIVTDADAFLRELLDRKIPFRDVEIAPVSLEDAFLRIVHDQP
jgi:ABC-2 type transport system ATP-binding protein